MGKKSKGSKRKTAEEQTVFVVEWSEYEEGYGTRPDGYSVHASQEDKDKYLEMYGRATQYHSSMPMRAFEMKSNKMMQRAKRDGGSYHTDFPVEK